MAKRYVQLGRIDFRKSAKEKNYEGKSRLYLQASKLPLDIDDVYVDQDGALECVIFWYKPREKKSYDLAGSVVPLLDGAPDYNNKLGFAYFYKDETKDSGFISSQQFPDMKIRFALWKDKDGQYQNGTVSLEETKPEKKKPTAKRVPTVQDEYDF